MIEGRDGKVWRPPKLFTVYQNACKQQTDKAACQSEFEKVFTCKTAATAITDDPVGCSGNAAVTCITTGVAAAEALNHDGCSFKCDAVAHTSGATYEACVTTAKADAEKIIPEHEVPGKKDDNPYFCCNKKIEAALFNNWEDWDVCQFAEATNCDTTNPDMSSNNCRNQLSAAVTDANPPRGMSFE